MSLAPYYYFTDHTRGVSPLDMVPHLPENCGVVFRHYNIDNRVYLAKQLAKSCKNRGLTLLIAADPELALAVGATGCHLPEHILTKNPAIRKKYPFLTFTAACHTVDALKLAEKSHMDAAFLSPVYATASHEGEPALGLKKARQLCAEVTMPIYGLGGITADNRTELLAAGFDGFGAISAFERGEFS